MATSAPPSTDPSANQGDESLSLTRLLRTLGNDLVTLVRQEVALAKAEVRKNIGSVGSHAGQIAVGGGVAVVGILVFVAFLVVGLGLLLDGAYWLSSLLVALLFLIAGGAMGYFGARGLGRGGLAPTATIESLAETKEWAGEEVREFRGSLKGEPPQRLLEGYTVTDRALPLAPQTGPRPGPTTATATATSTPTATASKNQVPGRDPARPPLSMPLIKRVFHEVSDDDVLGQAAKVAFYMFSSLPPALLVIFALTGLLGGDSVADFISSRLQGTLPGSADDPESAAGFVSRFVEQVVNENAPGPLSIGLLLGLWASSAVFVAMAEALNKAFDIVENRSWFRKRAMAIGVMLGFALLFLGGSVVLLGGPRIAEALRLGQVGSLVWEIGQWPLAFALVVMAFFMVYYILPNRDQSGCRKILLGSSAIATGLWLLATLGFRIYIDKFGSYSATYGFVGAVMVLLLWMYITSAVILIGGEISSEMERQPT